MINRFIAKLFWLDEEPIFVEAFPLIATILATIVMTSNGYNALPIFVASYLLFFGTIRGLMLLLYGN